MSTYRITCKILAFIASTLVNYLPSTRTWRTYPDEVKNVTTPEDFDDLIRSWERPFIRASNQICDWALQHDYYLH